MHHLIFGGKKLKNWSSFWSCSPWENNTNIFTNLCWRPPMSTRWATCWSPERAVRRRGNFRTWCLRGSWECWLLALSYLWTFFFVFVESSGWFCFKRTVITKSNKSRGKKISKRKQIEIVKSCAYSGNVLFLISKAVLFR